MISNAPPYLDLDNESILLALCIWREARNQSDTAMLGVKWVIKNRCSLAPREGFKPTINGNIFKPYAFSSFNENDPNANKFPKQDDPAWLRILDIVRGDSPDPTDGAVFYFSPPVKTPPKAWGNVVFAAKWDDLNFYKLPA
jgi:spore germination cell wall hydrolase CwlJ-like protein